MDKTKLKGVAALIAAAVAVILAAFLCMSFPMAEVHAAECAVSDGPRLVYCMAEAQEGDIIRLQDSITIDLTDEATVQSMYGGRVEANKDLYLSADTTYPAHSQTLDLNGKTLTIITGSDKSCFTLEGAITLTIIDSSAEGTGTIVGHSNGSLFYSETAESSLVLQDVAVKFTEYTEGGASITPKSAVIDTVGNVTLNNVTYTPAEGGPALIKDNAGAQVSYVADTAEELAAAVADSSCSTVMLGADITQNITVEAGRTLTLDLNGHTLSSEIGGVATIWNKGTLAIKSSAEGGTITREVSGMYYVIRNNGVMTIDGTNLTVYNDNASDGSSLIDNNILSTTDLEDESIVDRQAKLTITGGTYRSANSNAVKNDPNGTLIINSGSFTSNTAGNGAVFTYDDTTIIGGTFVNNNGYAVFASASGGIVNELKITGGTFTGNYAIHVQNGDPDNADAGKGTIHLTIEDGSFTGEVSAAATGFSITSNETIAVSGGSFNGSFGLSAYDSENISFTGGEFSAAINSSWYDSSLTQYVYTAGEKAGTFGVSSKIPENAIKLCVADRSGNYYATVAEAITALQAASGTRYIYLYVDVTENIEFSSVTGTWYFYLQGNTVNGTITYGGSGTLYIRDENGGGAIRNAGSSSAITLTSGTVRLQTYAGYSVENTDSSNTSPLINVQGGTFYVPTSTSYTGEVALSAANGGLIQVAEGAAANLQYADAVYTVEEGQAIFSGSGTVSVSGGIFSAKFDETFLAEDYIFVEQEGKFAVMQIIAQILQGDEVIYSSVISMQEAVEWAREQGYTSITVQLLANDTEGLTVNVGETITLDLGRYGSSGDIINNGDLTIEGEIQTGSVTSSRTVSGDVINQGSGTLTINGGMFRGAVRNDSTGELIINAGGFGGDNNGSYGNNARNAMQYLAANASFVDRASNQGGYLIADEADTAIYLTDTSVEEPLRFGTFSAAVGYAQYDAASETITFVLSADIQMTGRSTLGYYSSSNATIWEFELGEYSITSTDEYLWTLGNASNRPITVTVMGGELVIMTDGDSSDYAIRIRYGSSLTLNDVNIVYGAETQKPANMIYLSESGGSLSVESGNYYGSIDAVSGASITIAEGCVFEEDIKDVLGDGLTQNESGMVVPEESANAVAMIETADGIVYYDTLQAAVLAVEDGQTITVLADLTFNDALNIFKKDVDGRYTFTIDLNGNTITLSHGDGYPFALQVSGSRNNDSTGFGLIVKNGTIKGEANNTNAAELIRVNNQASLFLEDVTIEYTAGVNCSAMVMTLGGIYTDITDPSNPVAYQHILRNVIIKATQAGGVQVEGKAILENCTVDVQKGSGNRSVYVYSAVAASRGGTATIESGTYTSDAYGAYVFNTGGNFVINGGSFTAGEGYDVLRTDNTAKTQSITVTGGSFDGNIAIAEGTQMALSGGTYTVQLQADWLAADCAQIEADGTFTVGTEETLVTEQNAVAKIEETGVAYTSLQAAINAAESGATVTLLKDLTESVTVAAGQEIVLDLNGCTLTNSGTLTLKDVTVYQGTDAENALQWTFSSTIRNKGASAEKMAVMEVNGATVVSGRIALKNDDWGKMTIADAEVTGGNQAVQNWAQLEISGGTFAGNVVTWFYAMQGSEPETRTHATITGGTFNGRVMCVDYDQDSEGKVEIDEGVTISGTASFSEMPKYTYFADDYIAAWDEDSEMYVTAQGDWAAVINDETAYATLGEALAAAKDGDTVMLLNDIELASGSAVKAPSLGIALTIDLNGHTITSADGYSAVFDITTTKSFTLTSSKEGAAIEAAYALRLRGSGTGEVAIAVENIAFSGAYVFNSPLTFGRSNTTQVSVTLRNVHAAYTDNLKNMQSFLLNADRLASLQVTGSTITVSSTNAEKAQGAYAVNLIATEAAFTDSTIAATGTLARGIYSHNFGTVISALTLNNTAVTAEDIAIESSYADLTVNGGTVTSNASAAVLFFGHMTPESAAAAIDTQEGYQTLTVTGGAQISGYTFGIGGNAAGTYDGTVMNIEDAVITGGEEAPGVFQPHVGILNIGGENTKITGSSGVVVRAGRLNITGGTFIATYATLNTVEGSGSVIDGAAVAVSHHSSNQPLTVSITGGTFNGVYSVYEDTLLSGPDPAKVSVSLAGGVYNGGVYSENKAGFITGGSFKQQPAEELFDENYAAEYQNGYYVAVRSDALKTARANAQADVRGYAAANGISWLALAEEAAPAEGEEPVYTAQQAADILAAFNAIDSAMTQLAVAEARLAAMNMVDAYVEALDTYKLDMIGDLQTAAADDEETADVDESVVLPTATYSAIYNATSASEIDFYVENALAEIEAIRSLRTEISGQTQQLADLAEALEAMSDGLFGDTESGTKGAFAELFDKVQTAISDAQNAIVNGSEEGSTSLSSLQEYLAQTINGALTRIESALTDTETGLAAIKEALDTLDVSSQLADKFEDVLAAIIKAQDAITGSTDGEGGTSIGEAISQINSNTTTLVSGLRKALIGENGTLTQVAAAVQGLTDLNIGGEFDGVLTAITNAQNAIMGVTEEGADGVNLSEVLGAVGDVNSAVTDALATMNQTLAAWQQTVADYAETLASIETALGDGAGSLYDRIDSAITAAQDAIMGSTGGEGGTSIGAAVSDLKTELSVVQQAIIDAMPNYSDQLTTISRNIEALQTLLNGNNGLAAIKKELDGVVSAIGSATSGDTSASGLFALLEAIQSGNSTIESAVTAVQNALLGTNNNGALATITGALETALDDLDSLTGALLEANGGLATDITDALAAIDQIAAAIGSLGTGEGNDLVTQIGNIVSDLEEVQGAVNTIGDNLGVAVDIEETKTNAVAELENWLSAYLDTLLGTTTDEAESGVVMLAVTLETEDGDLYGRLTQAYSEANAQLILKYYNQALTAIDNATSTTDVSTAVSTFRAQVASVDAAAQNTPSMTGVYVLLAIVLVVLIAASIVVILKNRKAAAAVAAQPAAEAAAEEKPAEEAKPEAAEEAAEAESEEADKAEEELAADDDDKEQVVIAANVRSFAEAYVELSDEQRELFNKVKEYALGKEGTSEVKLSSGDCVKLGSKQVVKLAVRRGNPVALFVLENEMLKDFRRGATTQAKLKVRATELVLREEADLETAYTMVDLSVDQIKKDAAAAKERRREQRRERRKQRLAEEAARQAEHDGSED